MKEDKFILDATAGFRMMWFNKKHPNCVYLDERPECKPDVIGDFRNLNQFANGSFRLVVFDPPHKIRTTNDTSRLYRDYGALRPETWQNDLRKGFSECWRVLAPYGVLIFKWGETQKSVKEVSKFFPCSPLFRQISAGSTARNGRKARTLWFCFMKIPEKVK